MAKPYPQLREGQAPEGPFDVAIVGAGAVGCAVAHPLALRIDVGASAEHQRVDPIE